MADRYVEIPDMNSRQFDNGKSSSCYVTCPSNNGTVQRSTKAESSPTVLDISDPNLSLMDKWRLHAKSPISGSHKSVYAFRTWFQFQAITQLYMTLVYLIPYVFADYDPMTQYYLKVLVCYIFAMGEANWLCAIFYSNNLPDMRDRPNVDYNEWFRNPPEVFGQNGHIKTSMNTTDKNGLLWEYCGKCERYKPPRAHHCDMCETCILRRDHHCYLIGTCIGHYNQRYFIIFCFLGVITGGIGFYLTCSYLSGQSEAFTWFDYIFPWSLFKLLIGQVSWQFCLLTFHAEMLAVFGTLSFIYGTGQLLIVSAGKTLYEVAKEIDVKVTSSVGENLRLVFGDYWGFNFFFPAVILFKQRHDGIEYDNIKFGNSKVSVE